MGNSQVSHKQITQASLNNVRPHNKDDKSRLMNQMLVKVMRKLDNQTYLNPDDSDKDFIPKTIELDYDQSSKYGKENYESTQQLYSLSDSQMASPEKQHTQNSEASSRGDIDSGKGFKTPQPFGGPGNNNYGKENKHLNSTSNKPEPPTGMRSKNAENSGGQVNKFFVSQNKITAVRPVSSSLSNTKGLVNTSAGSGIIKSMVNVKSPNNGGLLKPPSVKNGLVNPTQYTRSGSSGNLMPGNMLSPSNIKDEMEAPNLADNLKKLPPKKKLYINCSFEKKMFALPSEVIFTVLTFVLDDYMNLALVSPLWYYKVNEVFDATLVSIDNSFIKSYMSILAFKRSFFSLKPFKISDKRGIRMDRNIIAEPLNCLVGKTVVVSYDYELKHKKGVRYRATYRFDVVRKGKRNIWIYKEECKHNYDETKLALIQPIMPVCVQDSIKFAINFYNLYGFLNLNSIKWLDPILEATPQIPLEIDFYDLPNFNKNRICEVEEIHHEWVPYKYFEKKEKVELDVFKPQLTLKETKCAGVDIITMKSFYTATDTGKVPRSLQKLGLELEIINNNDDMITEVRRNGLYIDLDCTLQLRVGDRLIFYLSKGE
jgi:hypothetical protein